MASKNENRPMEVVDGKVGKPLGKFSNGESLASVTSNLQQEIEPEQKYKVQDLPCTVTLTEKVAKAKKLLNDLELTRSISRAGAADVIMQIEVKAMIERDPMCGNKTKKFMVFSQNFVGPLPRGFSRREKGDYEIDRDLIVGNNTCAVSDEEFPFFCACWVQHCQRMNHIPSGKDLLDYYVEYCSLNRVPMYCDLLLMQPNDGVLLVSSSLEERPQRPGENRFEIPQVYTERTTLLRGGKVLLNIEDMELPTVRESPENSPVKQALKDPECLRILHDKEVQLEDVPEAKTTGPRRAAGLFSKYFMAFSAGMDAVETYIMREAILRMDFVRDETLSCLSIRDLEKPQGKCLCNEGAGCFASCFNIIGYKCKCAAAGGGCCLEMCLCAKEYCWKCAAQVDVLWERLWDLVVCWRRGVVPAMIRSGAISMWRIFNSETRKDLKIATNFCSEGAFSRILNGEKLTLQVIGRNESCKKGDLIRLVSRSSSRRDYWEGAIIVTIEKILSSKGNRYLVPMGKWFHIERYIKPGKYRMTGDLDDLRFEYLKAKVTSHPVFRCPEAIMENGIPFFETQYPEFRRYPPALFPATGMPVEGWGPPKEGVKYF